MVAVRAKAESLPLSDHLAARALSLALDPHATPSANAEALSRLAGETPNALMLALRRVELAYREEPSRFTSLAALALRVAIERAGILETSLPWP